MLYHAVVCWHDKWSFTILSHFSILSSKTLTGKGGETRFLVRSRHSLRANLHFFRLSGSSKIQTHGLSRVLVGDPKSKLPWPSSSKQRISQTRRHRHHKVFSDSFHLRSTPQAPPIREETFPVHIGTSGSVWQRMLMDSV